VLDSRDVDLAKRRVGRRSAVAWVRGSFVVGVVTVFCYWFVTATLPEAPNPGAGNVYGILYIRLSRVRPWQLRCGTIGDLIVVLVLAAIVFACLATIIVIASIFSSSTPPRNFENKES
jgi:hypothetical protein